MSSELEMKADFKHAKILASGKKTIQIGRLGYNVPLYRGTSSFKHQNTTDYSWRSGI